MGVLLELDGLEGLLTERGGLISVVGRVIGIGASLGLFGGSLCLVLLLVMLLCRLYLVRCDGRQLTPGGLGDRIDARVVGDVGRLRPLL